MLLNRSVRLEIRWGEVGECLGNESKVQEIELRFRKWKLIKEFSEGPVLQRKKPQSASANTDWTLCPAFVRDEFRYASRMASLVSMINIAREKVVREWDDPEYGYIKYGSALFRHVALYSSRTVKGFSIYRCRSMPWAALPTPRSWFYLFRLRWSSTSFFREFLLRWRCRCLGGLTAVLDLLDMVATNCISEMDWRDD